MPRRARSASRPTRCGGKNFIRPEQMPYKTATGKTYDTGEFDGQMSRALKLADWDGFAARAETAQERGLLRGIGIATYIEACGGNGPDTATLSLEKDGIVHVHVGTQTTGQGHDTAYLADRCRSSVAAARSRAHAAGRHRADRDRHRHRRVEFDSRPAAIRLRWPRRNSPIS